MYAKLVFPSGTTSGEAVRDIARLINDSSSGSASLDNLEFATAASSELYAGTNSGWSLHSSTSLGSGAISATDAKYILEGTTATGSKSKYVGIQINAHWTSSTLYDNSSVGICLSGVLDPGAATEFWSYGYASTNNTYYGRNSINPSGTIHIWAEPRKLMIYGTTINNNGLVQGLFEAAETPNTTYRELPPTVFFSWGRNGLGSSQGKNQVVSVRGGSFFGETYITDNSVVQWVGSMYSDNTAAEGTVRCLGVYSGYVRGGDTYIDDFYNSSQLRISDGTTNGTSVTTNYIGSNFRATWFPNIRYEMFGPGGNSVSTSIWPDTNWGKSNMNTRDSSGNKAIPLRPIVADWPVLCADIYNISNICNMWWAPTGLGAVGDTVTIGSDVYQYVPYQSSNTGGAILVKRI